MKGKIITIISEFTGLNEDEITGEESLTEDFHMGPTELTDFKETLVENNLTTPEGLDFSQIETVNELIEQLVADEI